MISTRNLRGMASVPELMRIMQSLAMLDAILEEEWEYRYFSFNSNWSRSEAMGSMRNGSGDDMFALFDSKGCFLRGFDHESAMSPWNCKPNCVWDGVLSDVPSDFASSLNQAAFHMSDTTFCIWRQFGDDAWRCGPVIYPEGNDPDGSEWMLSMLDGSPRTYVEFARDYFELSVLEEAVEAVFAHTILSQELLNRFSSKRSLTSVVADAVEIGYPY